MRFLGDANRFDADVKQGEAELAGLRLPAPGVPDGKAQVFVRPADLDWAQQGEGLPARILRVIDRPENRRILALTERDETVELDVDVDTVVSPKEQGFLRIRRASVFAA